MNWNRNFLGISTKLFESMTRSRFKDELVSEVGELFFRKAEMMLRTYSDEVKDDLKRENKLVTEYDKLIASAAIDYKGEKRNLAQMRPFMVSDDRAERKTASKLYFGFFETNLEQLDRIYDDLVKIRTSIAKRLGFENFTELGYHRMGRLDYDKEMVAAYRSQVLDEVVPLSSDLRRRQASRLGLESLDYFDLDYTFKSGVPKPKGDPDWIMEQGSKMYGELSEDTREFYGFMMERELVDLVAKPGKSTGGYCMTLEDYKAPFVFSNFNGTQEDVEVLTHEMGHAFQSYKSGHIDIPELIEPTMESAEIHSMSMEFLTYPWMKNFFQEDTDKFKFAHMSSGILFILTVCLWIISSTRSILTRDEA